MSALTNRSPRRAPLRLLGRPGSFVRRATATPALLAGLVMTTVLVLIAVLAPVLATHDPAQQNLTGILLGPTAENWFGTDQLGRDIYSRLIFAARTDLTLAGLAVITPFVVGVSLGLISGYFGGWVDWIVSRITETVIAFPFYIIIIVIVFAVGVGQSGIVAAFTLVGWVAFARVVRASTRTLVGSEWVSAARGLGLPHARILVRHLLPNVLPQAVVILMTEIVLVMVAIVTLGYLGLGVQPPTADWGTMIAEGQPFMLTKWWLSVVPGLAVVYSGIALSLVGDGLADVWRVK